MENVVLPDPTQWGWTIKDEKFVPRWQAVEIFDISTVTSSCSCKKKLCKNWLIDLKQSFMIGDSQVDKLCAKKSNLYFEY